MNKRNDLNNIDNDKAIFDKNLFDQSIEAYDIKSFDKYRLRYHLMPLRGLLADPNGMCQIGDTFHIYYIYNPLACIYKTRTPLVWGHYSTKDFIHFKNEPIALYADNLRDKDGVYSGCTYLEDETMHIYYTGNVRHAGNHDYVTSGREQNVLYTSSKDSYNFTEKKLLMTNEDFPDNMTQHVRDPKVWKEDDSYFMILGARSLDDVGSVLVYESKDKFNWQYINNVTTKNTFGYMWECPDLISLPDSISSNDQRILIVCPQGVEQDDYKYQNSHQCGYFRLDGDFKSDYELSSFEQFDYGFDFYAARTFVTNDNQTILVAWLGVSECDYTVCSKTKDWQQAIAMPRVLSYKDNHLYQKPLEQIKSLRKNHLEIENQAFKANNICFELQLTLTQEENINIQLREDCFIKYDVDTKILSLEMGLCGDGRKSRTVKLDTLSDLTIFSDSSSLEIFINEGYCTMTSRIFGDSDDIIVEKSNCKIDYYELNGYEIEW